MPQAKPDQLRYALAQRLGRVLTPEHAAWVEAVALANAMPMPQGADGVDVSQSPQALAFINERVDARYEASDSITLARVSGGRIRAVVLFSEMTRHAIEMAVASDGAPNWINKAILRLSFSYPFNTLGVSVIYGRIKDGNTQALRMNESLGFRVVGSIPRGFGDCDCILMAMTRQECRWIGETKP